MTEKLRQSLSAAVDDEADAFELRRVLDELGRDSELRALWDRYHLIGSVMRGDGRIVTTALREQVWEAVESVVEAPAGEESVVAGADAAASEPVDATASRHRTSRWGRYTGFAVAASVAFAVVLGLNGVWNGADLAGQQVARNGTDRGVPDVVPARVADADTAVPVVERASQVSATDVQRAQAYMLHHTQQQALNQAGVMSFVKLATYEAP